MLSLSDMTTVQYQSQFLHKTDFTITITRADVIRMTADQIKHHEDSLRILIDKALSNGWQVEMIEQINPPHYYDSMWEWRFSKK